MVCFPRLHPWGLRQPLGVAPGALKCARGAAQVKHFDHDKDGSLNLEEIKAIAQHKFEALPEEVRDLQMVLLARVLVVSNHRGLKYVSGTKRRCLASVPSILVCQYAQALYWVPHQPICPRRTLLGAKPLLVLAPTSKLNNSAGPCRNLHLYIRGTALCPDHVPTCPVSGPRCAR